MNPDWINALIGGVMIGAASGLLMLANGKIAGVSDILGRLIASSKPFDWMERGAFLIGLLIIPLVFFAGKYTTDITITSNLALLITGGFAVGFGARMGSGCTSGHGICGNARLSKRSIVATIVFISTGMLTVASQTLI